MFPMGGGDFVGFDFDVLSLLFSGLFMTDLSVFRVSKAGNVSCERSLHWF